MANLGVLISLNDVFPSQEYDLETLLYGIPTEVVLPALCNINSRLYFLGEEKQVQINLAFEFFIGTQSKAIQGQIDRNLKRFMHKKTINKDSLAFFTHYSLMMFMEYEIQHPRTHSVIRDDNHPEL